MQLLFRSF
uniref:Uncharacterized protein n=1 Tax=Anguilla anguilla TaxID=7936 RepID=A0A0E9Q9C9_ANGAN